MDALANGLRIWSQDRQQLQQARWEAWSWGTRQFNWDVEKKKLLNVVSDVLSEARVCQKCLLIETQRRTVLIIAPDFTPSSYPPALRARFFAQHLPEFGWKPIVLAADPEQLRMDSRPRK